MRRFKPPRSEERVQGTKFLAGVWGKAPSRAWGGNPIEPQAQSATQDESGSEAIPDGGFPQIFQSGAKDPNSAFFQQYLDKMHLSPLENPLLDEKDSKSVKKRLKKGLTRGRNRDIITELSAQDTNSPDSTDP